MKENTVGGIKYKSVIGGITSEEEEYQKQMAQSDEICDWQNLKNLQNSNIILLQSWGANSKTIFPRVVQLARIPAPTR